MRSMSRSEAHRVTNRSGVRGLVAVPARTTDRITDRRLRELDARIEAAQQDTKRMLAEIKAITRK